MVSEDKKKILDSASEIYLWYFIETLGGFVWRMNHDMADGRIESSPGIEKDLVIMQEDIEYAVEQLERFSIKDPRGEGSDQYWEWYKMWKEYTRNLSDADFNKVDKLMAADISDPCYKFSPYEKDMFFGKKIKEFRLKYANQGLRNFASTMNMLASELCDIEHGYKEPQDALWLHELITKLEIGFQSYEAKEIHRLWLEPFVMRKMPENVFPAIVCTNDGSTPTREKITEIAKFFDNRAKEHNLKADEYNKEHGVN